MSTIVRVPHRTIGFVAVLATLALSASITQAAPPDRTYRVTIRNLMPAPAGGGQVLSPALVVVHDRSFDLWSVGSTAEAAVVDVAEQAQTATGVAQYRSIGGVELATSEGSQIAGGQEYTFEITATGDARFLSLVSMLGNTNDAFTGLDAIHLTGATKEYRVFAYDAGSEVNDQLRASIPGPCCNGMTGAGTPESGTIQRHEGILANTGDLTPELWGWPVNQPVAVITVERIRE
jgi:hypothetical protein